MPCTKSRFFGRVFNDALNTFYLRLNGIKTYYGKGHFPTMPYTKSHLLEMDHFIKLNRLTSNEISLAFIFYHTTTRSLITHEFNVVKSMALIRCNYIILGSHLRCLVITVLSNYSFGTRSISCFMDQKIVRRLVTKETTFNKSVTSKSQS